MEGLRLGRLSLATALGLAGRWTGALGVVGDCGCELRSAECGIDIIEGSRSISRTGLNPNALAALLCRGNADMGGSAGDVFAPSVGVVNCARPPCDR